MPDLFVIAPHFALALTGLRRACAFATGCLRIERRHLARRPPPFLLLLLLFLLLILALHLALFLILLVALLRFWRRHAPRPS